MSVEIRHAYADVNGVRLHYAAAGAGPLVLFVHGFPEFWYEWRHQLEDFGRELMPVPRASITMSWKRSEYGPICGVQNVWSAPVPMRRRTGSPAPSVS